MVGAQSMEDSFGGRDDQPKVTSNISGLSKENKPTYMFLYRGFFVRIFL